MGSSAFALGSLYTILPFYTGLLTFSVPQFRRHSQATLALALGMSLYFFIDGFNDSAALGVTQGLLGGLQPLVLVVSFAVTFSVLTFARRASDDAWPLWIVAVGISIHSFSEASDVSSSASLYFANLSYAIPTASSFMVHKFLEGFVLASAAIGFGVPKLKQVITAGTPMLLFAVTGSLAGVLYSLQLSPFIASGVGGWLFVAVGLASYLEKRNRPSVLVLVLVGFIIVYSGALFHYTVVVPG